MLCPPAFHLSLAAVLLLVPPVFFELVLLAPWPAWFYGAYAAGLGLLLWGFRPQGDRSWRWVLGSFVLVLVILWVVPWSSRKVFLRDLARIEPGMNRAQVEEILDGYIHGSGWHNPFVESGTLPEELEIQGAKVFRHSNDGRFNSDWGVVHFENDRVSSVEFLYD